MTEYRIVRARPEHADELWPDIRQEDEIEIRRATGRDPKEMIRLSIEHSVDAIAGYADDKLVLLAGVGPRGTLIATTGEPWLVGSNELKRHAVKMCRENRIYVRKWLRMFGTLVNYVDDENKTSQAWLRWLGFKLEEPAPYGPEGHLFRRFSQEGE